MREIKFRAWDIEANRIMDDIECGEWTIEALTSCSLDVMQYTNLKDKNGKEIYEKDIIRWNDTNTIIRYEVFDGGWVFDNHIPGQYGTEFFDYQASINCEIIGNIYENPELIEEK
jgi:uncharacterized phage protein (TIGR01671 family)